MPPYLRFPEPEAITQRFWGCRPRNPTCGLVSLEKGTKIFAWGNMIYAATFAICCILIILIHLGFPKSYPSHNHEDVLAMSKLKQNSILKDDADVITSLYKSHSIVAIQSILFFSFIFFSMWWFISWKLKNAVVERDLPTLKKYYVIMLVLMLLIIVSTIWETESLWSKAFLFDIPWTDANYGLNVYPQFHC